MLKRLFGAVFGVVFERMESGHSESTREREREERESVILREKKGNEKKTNEKDKELGWGKKMQNKQTTERPPLFLSLPFFFSEQERFAKITSDSRGEKQGKKKGTRIICFFVCLDVFVVVVSL